MNRSFALPWVQETPEMLAQPKRVRLLPWLFIVLVVSIPMVSIVAAVATWFPGLFESDYIQRNAVGTVLQVVALLVGAYLIAGQIRRGDPLVVWAVRLLLAYVPCSEFILPWITGDGTGIFYRLALLQPGVAIREGGGDPMFWWKLAAVVDVLTLAGAVWLFWALFARSGELAKARELYRKSAFYNPVRDNLWRLIGLALLLVVPSLISSLFRLHMAP